MSRYKISYILTTYNKLLYLKTVLDNVIKKIDFETEEIIIIDGGSTDGTREYLLQLKTNNLVTKYVSERDFGEAHGFNKALLLSEGDFIKLLTDDDYIDIDIVRESVKFLIPNSEIDYLFSNGYNLSLRNGKMNFELLNFISEFNTWKQNRTPFGFCGLGLILRRSSLPLIGIFNTNFMRVDAEFSYRNTSNKSKFAFENRPSWVRIINSSSNSFKFHNKVVEEEIAFRKLYNKSYLTYALRMSVKKYFRGFYYKYFKKNRSLDINISFDLLFQNSIEIIKNDQPRINTFHK